MRFVIKGLIKRKIFFFGLLEKKEGKFWAGEVRGLMKAGLGVMKAGQGATV